jgi:hypothetical protein
MNGFLTWDPLQFGELDFDKSPVPTDHNTSISSVRSYLAQAIIMWYDTSVRDKNAQAWDRLLASWKATFHSELTAGALEKWPTDGPHGFSEDQSTWLAATLRYLLKGQGRASRRRVSAPPRPASPGPPPAAKPASRNSTRCGRGGGASGTARNPDPVQSTGRSGIYYKSNYVHYGYYCYYTAYFNYTNYINFTIDDSFSFFFILSQEKTSPGHRCSASG